MPHFIKLPNGHLGKNTDGHLTNNCLAPLCCPSSCFQGGGLCVEDITILVSGFTDTCCVWMNGTWDLPGFQDCIWSGPMSDPAPSFASAGMNLSCVDDVWTFVLEMFSGPFDIGSCSSATETYEGTLTACGNACGCGDYTMARTTNNSGCPNDDPIMIEVCS
jgi:hypothetical protein